MGVSIDAYACWHLPERATSNPLSARDDGQWILVRGRVAAASLYSGRSNRSVMRLVSLVSLVL
jgi:hypothetical protein